MSSTWRYDSESEMNEILAIWSDGALNHQLRIYTWKVRLNTGEVRGLYSLKPEEFTRDADKKALSDAMKNAQELSKKNESYNERIIAQERRERLWCC